MKVDGGGTHLGPRRGRPRPRRRLRDRAGRADHQLRGAEERGRRGRRLQPDRLGRQGGDRDVQLGHLRCRDAGGGAQERRECAAGSRCCAGSRSSSRAATAAPTTASGASSPTTGSRVDFPSDSPQVVSVGGTLLSVQTSGGVRHRVGVGGPALELGRGRRDQHVRRRSLVAGGRACRERTAGGSRRVREREPDERLARPRLRQLGLVRRHERGDAVLGGLDAALGATRGEAGRQADAASSRRSSTSSPRRISPTRRSTTWCTGANRHYDAGPGWDYATGLGSPDVYNLARDLVAYLRTNPCGPSS